MIQVDQLIIGYYNNKKQVPVASGLSFSVKAGDFTAIVGINGIGKSTLLRTLGKLQPQLSGSIQINGKSITKYLPVAWAKEVSIVLTEAIPAKNLTVWELVALGRQPHTNWIGKLTANDKAVISDAIAHLELSKLQQHKCHTLSDGQLQRVMIARALAQDTPIILLDEPTTHLDLYHKVYILKLLRSIAHKTQKTIIFTTHEIEMAIRLCDKMVLLHKKNSAFGTPKDLTASKSFEKLFPADTIKFDTRDQSFKLIF